MILSTRWNGSPEATASASLLRSLSRNHNGGHPGIVLFGAFDAWVEREVLPGVESGALTRDDMVAVVATLRRWETGGIWGAAHVR